ncbi:YhcH/YjgK/YiaL family protein [Photobacterium japonica]|uniref:YhcH/YjgK/YiaL family protein n=1 Tax=Photobacterium japonica TaxID=2910235 RepID=UPI003D0B876F
MSGADTAIQTEKGTALPAAVMAIIRQVKEQLAAQQAPGRYEVVAENVTPDDVFYFIADDHTQVLSERKSECHAKYMDVQIVLEGEECFGYSLKPFTAIDEDLLAEKDLAFSEQVIDEQFATLQPGDFIIFDTFQPHRPLVAPQQPAPVKKVVVKIAKAWADRQA